MKKLFYTFFLLLILLFTVMLCGCTNSKESVIIYTSAEDYRIEHMRSRLSEEFPQYDIVIEYMSTGNHGAKLLAEGTETECDITYDLEYTYLDKLVEENILADLSAYDFTPFAEDTVKSKFYMPDYRNSGAVIINPEVLEKQGLDVPKSYDDLLKAEYKGFISMPDPKLSGTGYIFLLSLVNERGEKAAFEYFDSLSENILQFTSSGAGPVNALIQGEAAIGLGIIGNAVAAINNGNKLEIVMFDEGSPYTLYGQGIISGKENKTAVKEVFDFLYSVYVYENCEKFFPEKIFNDKDFKIDNYPSDIKYSDMSNNSAKRKEDLLSKWKY